MWKKSLRFVKDFGTFRWNYYTQWNYTRIAQHFDTENLEFLHKCSKCFTWFPRKQARIRLVCGEYINIFDWKSDWNFDIWVQNNQNDVRNWNIKLNFEQKQRDRDIVKSITDFVVTNFDVTNDPNETNLAIHRQISIKLIN